MADFVLNVRQVAQYPSATSAAPGDAMLLQRGGVGGAYMSLDPQTLMQTALATGGWLQLAPGPAGGIAFNGAAMALESNTFVFSEPLAVPGLSSASDIFVAGNALATQTWVQAIFDVLAEQGYVYTFNGRQGFVQLESDDILRAGGVLATNPAFNGVVTAPTSWNLQANDDTVATTAWVQQWAMCSGNVVHTFMGRGGDVVLQAGDVSFALTQSGVYAEVNTPPDGDVSRHIANAQFVDNAIADVQTWALGMFETYQQINALNFAPLNSPNFTGIPTGPTANPGTDTGQLATTAFVQAAVVASTTGVSTWNGRTGTVTLQSSDITGASGALTISPVFTGTPAAPTAAPGNSSTQIATTAFVTAAVAAIPAGGVTSFNTRTGAIVLAAADVSAAGGALLAGPTFSGTPSAPTATIGTNTTQIATTAFVQAALSGVTAGVSSWNGRTGAVTLNGSDVSAAGGALINSPTFTGSPAAPTATPGNSSTLIATTAFVMNAVAASTAGVTSFNGRTGAVVFGAGDITAAGGALLASPAFTGTPAGPTAAPNTNTTQLATTAFVAAAIAASPGGVTSFNTRTGAITLNSSDVSAAGGALLNSPAFVGNPTAPTQTTGTSNTTLATTAFVSAAIAAGGGVNTFNGRAGNVVFSTADLLSVNGAIYSVSDTAPLGALATDNAALWWDSVHGQLMVKYNNGTTSQWVVANAPTPPPTLPALANFIDGYQSSPVTAGSTTITWGVGVAYDTTNAVLIVNTSASWTKTLSAYAAGTGNGGMVGGTVAANTSYYVFAAIINGVFDIFYDTSITGANAPTGTSAKRRVWAFKTQTSAAALRGWTQRGDVCMYSQGQPEWPSSTGAPTGTAAQGTLASIPLLNIARVFCKGTFAATSASTTLILTSFDETASYVGGTGPFGTVTNFAAGGGTAFEWHAWIPQNKVWFVANQSGGSVGLSVDGYEDPRGRDGQG